MLKISGVPVGSATGATASRLTPIVNSISAGYFIPAGGASITTTWNDFVTGGPPLFAAWMVTGGQTAVEVGVPEMMPVFSSNDNPTGRPSPPIILNTTLHPLGTTTACACTAVPTFNFRSCTSKPVGAACCTATVALAVDEPPLFDAVTVCSVESLFIRSSWNEAIPPMAPLCASKVNPAGSAGSMLKISGVPVGSATGATASSLTPIVKDSCDGYENSNRF